MSSVPDMPEEKAGPLVSVVMAAYNEAENIGKAIQSVIDQTICDWELIVVDDGSHDQTTEVVRAFAVKDGRVKLVVNKTNIGLPGSLNKGFAIARGAYIARADADDVNMPERLEKQYKYMQKNSDIDVLGTGAFLLDTGGKRVRAIYLSESHDELKNLGFLKTIFFHSSVMAKKSFLNRVGIYDISYTRAQDKELWLRGLKSGCRYANLQDALIEYRTDGYVRSWHTIRSRTLSLLRIAKRYKVRHGYLLVVLSLLLALSVKLGLRVPRSLRPR